MNASITAQLIDIKARDEKDFENVEKVSAILVEMGYPLIAGDELTNIHGNPDTIKDGREAYRIAKAEAKRTA